MQDPDFKDKKKDPSNIKPKKTALSKPTVKEKKDEPLVTPTKEKLNANPSSPNDNSPTMLADPNKEFVKIKSPRSIPNLKKEKEVLTERENKDIPKKKTLRMVAEVNKINTSIEEPKNDKSNEKQTTKKSGEDLLTKKDKPFKILEDSTNNDSSVNSIYEKESVEKNPDPSKNSTLNQIDTNNRLLMTCKIGKRGRIIIHISGTVLAIKDNITYPKNDEQKLKNEAEQKKYEKKLTEGLNTYICGRSVDITVTCNVQVKFITIDNKDELLDKLFNKCTKGNHIAIKDIYKVSKPDTKSQGVLTLSKGVIIVLTCANSTTTLSGDPASLKGVTQERGENAQLMCVSSDLKKDIGYTAAHEFCHLLGVGHKGNLLNLMYYKDEDNIFNKHVTHHITDFYGLLYPQLHCICDANFGKEVTFLKSLKNDSDSKTFISSENTKPSRNPNNLEEELPFVSRSTSISENCQENKKPPENTKVNTPPLIEGSSKKDDSSEKKKSPENITGETPSLSIRRSNK